MKISVLMPIRNGARFLPQALNSLSQQTLDDWELVVILDASTDESEEILAGWGDRRLRVLKLSEPNGISNALNRGIQVADGEIVARLDSDDECYPARLITQAREMERRPNLGLLGSYATIINEHGLALGLRRVAHGPRLKHWLVMRNQFIHPSVMVRRSILEKLGGYRAGLRTHEDYELWLRLSRIADVDNITQPLVRYRIHGAQTVRHSDDMALARPLIRRGRAELCTTLGIPQSFSAGYGLIWDFWQRRHVNPKRT